MSIQVCKFYSCNRNCKFGKHCRYLHSLPETLSQHISIDHNGVINQEQGTLLSLPVVDFCSAQKESNVEQDGINLDSRSKLQSKAKSLDSTLELDSKSDQDEKFVTISDREELVKNTVSKKPCQFFSRNGRCRFGRGCRFAHDATSRPNKGSTNVRGQNLPPRFQQKKVASSSSSKPPLTVDEDVPEHVSPSKASAEPSSSPCHTAKAPNKVVDTKSTKVKDVGSKSKKDNAGTGRVRFCKFFKSGYCYKGKKCLFAHQEQIKTEDSGLDSRCEKDAECERRSVSRPKVIRPPGISQVIDKSEIEVNGVNKYRQFDVNFLEKRFQGSIDVKKELAQSDEYVADIVFKPSDPDWPFDMKFFIFMVTLPKEYPKQQMVVTLPVEKQELPQSVQRFLEVSIEEWIDQRYKDAAASAKVELMARSFFKWLDKNIEDLMTGALTQLKRDLTAKAAGLEFVSAGQLRAKFKATSVVGPQEEDSDDDRLSGDEEANSSDSDECLLSEDCDSDDDSRDSSSDKENGPSLELDTERKGTEISLRYLQLKQNASSLMMTKLKLIVQCSRCKTSAELMLSQGKVTMVTCAKCSHDMLVRYRPTLAHALSSVVGYLDLEDCVAFDLVLQDSTMVVSCLACSKTTVIDGMISGQLTDEWCRACNARFKMAAESVRFYHLEPSSVITKGIQVEKVVSKNRKPPKDPAIREGHPLPYEGTCRHYKQSYRWLRFPCCGKAYPCDVCHDKKEDHPMEMATRMICGHCSREQNFSASRPCTSCNGHMTKVRSAHWEGGAGCRDKVAMSRGDLQKYKNMNKTVSNHSKKVSAMSSGKKKTTKLRHA